mmetsp:Transcript_6172/g.7784  ORF Transcript_6172/g.7784 Transcript_6172/m.7784 type:complete len:129 (-) Transcript_6172:98-484(-)
MKSLHSVRDFEVGRWFGKRICVIIKAKCTKGHIDSIYSVGRSSSSLTNIISSHACSRKLRANRTRNWSSHEVSPCGVKSNRDRHLTRYSIQVYSKYHSCERIPDHSEEYPKTVLGEFDLEGAKEWVMV